MKLASAETCIGEHLLKRSERVSIALWSRVECYQPEHGENAHRERNFSAPLCVSRYVSAVSISLLL